MTIKQRLFALLAALQEVQDNYGINECQRVAFNGQKNELQDIINTMDEAPPAPPVTVDDVLQGVTAQLGAIAGTVQTLVQAGYDEVASSFGVVSEKVDALVALANTAGEPARA